MATSHAPGLASAPVRGFLAGLRHLTSQELSSMIVVVLETRTTVADSVEWWVATTTVARDLRRHRLSRSAAVAFRQASEAVLAIPGAERFPHDVLVQAARSAGEVAGALVSGCPPAAVAVLTRGWDPLLPPAYRVRAA
jgi:hypothetical protein